MASQGDLVILPLLEYPVQISSISFNEVLLN